MTTNETTAHDHVRYRDADSAETDRADIDRPDGDRIDAESGRDAELNQSDIDAGSTDVDRTDDVDGTDTGRFEDNSRVDSTPNDLSGRPEFEDIQTPDAESEPAGEVVTGQPAPDMSAVAPTPTTSAVQSGQTGSGDDDGWRELQGRFVDDPEAAVREAGVLIEKDLAALRSRLETGDTENLRTAFRKYRDLHATLR
jgi:hypothetical protein